MSRNLSNVEKVASHFHVSLWTLFTVLRHPGLYVPMFWSVNVFKNGPAWPFHGSGPVLEAKEESGAELQNIFSVFMPEEVLSACSAHLENSLYFQSATG